MNDNTLYYLRAYAVNSAGEAFGNEVSFTTEKIKDGDGNSYKTVIIGNQVWIVENLNTTNYNDGTPIPNISDNILWYTDISGAYCDNDNIHENSETYGRFYNWYVVCPDNPKEICPSGWHVPTNEEWTALRVYLDPNGSGSISKNVAGIKLEEAYEAHWGPGNTVTNESGFTALLSGYRYYDNLAGLDRYEGSGNACSWWSITEYDAERAYDASIYNSRKGLSLSSLSSKNFGKSIRCLRNY